MSTMYSNERPVEERQVALSGFSGPNAALQAADQAWVLELGEDGTVLYARTSPSNAEGRGSDELKGLNFFEEFTAFEDLPAYRRHFRSFISSRKAAASFTWRRASEHGAVDARVLMTRAFRTEDSVPQGVVMMEIKN